MSRHQSRSPEDPDDQEELREAERRRVRQQIADTKAVLASPEGRRFVWDLLSSAGILQRSYTGNSATFYNEGRRAMGLDILERVQAADATAFPNMMIAESQRIERETMRGEAMTHE